MITPKNATPILLKDEKPFTQKKMEFVENQISIWDKIETPRSRAINL